MPSYREIMAAAAAGCVTGMREDVRGFYSFSIHWTRTKATPVRKTMIDDLLYERLIAIVPVRGNPWLATLALTRRGARAVARLRLVEVDDV